jgi:riboflavin kinase / FMN adenylyltransferase
MSSSSGLHFYFDGPVESLGLGVFDGLHRGHRALTDQCDAILTFHPHPNSILKKDSDLKYLSTVDELQTLFPHLITLRFTRELSQLSARTFLDTILLEQIKPKRIVVGYDYRFGYKREGDFTFLKAWSDAHNIEAVCVSPFEDGGAPVKSGRIRHLILTGQFDEALTLLGHPYLLSGEVIKGDGRGRALGFPTANLQVSSIKLIPSKGVYAGHIEIDGQRHLCIIYIGNKPTFSGEDKGVEVHIPGFKGDLYGRHLMVSLTRFIRGEQTFVSSDALVAQIEADLVVLNA